MRAVLLLPLLLALSGCSSIVGHVAVGPCGRPAEGVYPGTQLDVKRLDSVAFGFGDKALAVVDLLPSLLLDTVLVPLDLTTSR